MNKKINLNKSFLYFFIAFIICDLDIIFNFDYLILGDRVNYLEHVSLGFTTNFNSIFSIFNLEVGWNYLLNIIKLITSTENDNFVLRIITFISSYLFLIAFNKRTNSLIIPIFLIFLPSVFDFYIVKLRHGLALSIFAYTISMEYSKFRSFLYLIILSIHNSFLITIPIYLSGIQLIKRNFKKNLKALVNFIYLILGCSTGYIILGLMEIIGIRQFEYLSKAVEINSQGEGTGLYKLAILVFIVCLCIIKTTSYDSDAILYSSSYFLGISFTSPLGGRLLTSLLPFLVAELLTSQSKINKNIFWFIRVLISIIFILGWLIRIKQPALGLAT